MTTVPSFIFDKRKAYSILAVSTLTFIIGYMVWMMFAVIGVFIKSRLNLNATEFGLLMAVPVFTGSLMRAPLGFLVDRFGGRIVMFVVLLFSVIPIWLVSYAKLYWHFLALGIFTGIVGGTYGIGIPYVAHWFPKHRQGLAMSIYGAGSIGTTLNKMLAPLLIALSSWVIVPQVYACLVLVAALLFWLFSYQNTDHITTSKVTLREQIGTLKDKIVLCYCHYYSISFGAFVALSLWMVQYYKDEFSLSLEQAAFLTACFTFPASMFRILGGWLSDKYDGQVVTLWTMRIGCLCTFFLSFPSASITFFLQGFYVELVPYIFAVLMFILGTCLSLSKASVYKFISDNYIAKIGAVSGIVGTVAGISGSLWLFIFGFLFDLTGIRSTTFMFLFLMIFLALILLRATKTK